MLSKVTVLDPGTRTGRVGIPSSKSLAHRALICRAFDVGLSGLKGDPFLARRVLAEAEICNAGLNELGPLMRLSNPKWLLPQRASVATALTLPALKGYLQRECGKHFDADKWETVRQRLLAEDNAVVCDSYGNRELLNGRLLPVVCHRKDAGLFEVQKTRCLAAAAGAVLVSARIAKGEQDIINTAIRQGCSVVTVEDNGFPSLYHPSEQRIDLCSNNKLLIVSPWKYVYRRAADTISVIECKTMNCVVQALCRTKDSWWKSIG